MFLQVKEYLNVDTSSFKGTDIHRFDRTKNTEVEFEGQKYMVDSIAGMWIKEDIKRGDMEAARQYLDYALKDTAPSTIFIRFLETGNKEEEYKDNEVTLNAETGEVIRISRHKEFEEVEGEIDKNKVKEVAVKFLEKYNLTPSEETNWDEMVLFPKEGEAALSLKVNGGMVVDVDIDLKDYSVMNFYKVSIMYPNEEITTL